MTVGCFFLDKFLVVCLLFSLSPSQGNAGPLGSTLPASQDPLRQIDRQLARTGPRKKEPADNRRKKQSRPGISRPTEQRSPLLSLPKIDRPRRKRVSPWSGEAAGIGHFLDLGDHLMCQGGGVEARVGLRVLKRLELSLVGSYVALRCRGDDPWQSGLPPSKPIHHRGAVGAGVGFYSKVSGRLRLVHGFHMGFAGEGRKIATGWDRTGGFVFALDVLAFEIRLPARLALVITPYRFTFCTETYTQAWIVISRIGLRFGR